MRDIDIIFAVIITVVFVYFLFLSIAFLMRPEKKEEEWQDGDAGPNWGKDGN